MLDNEVISAPGHPRADPRRLAVRFRATSPSQQANDLAILLRAGALPAPLTIIEERTVGPGLGQDSIAKGKIASYVGSVMVIVFMLATYGLFGLFANVAVAVNVAMIFGVLSMLSATLTLPGIAGIVLTVGIAVDSNVLIYERIREEVRAGRTPITAIDAGFTRALATILDSNITTFIAAAVLFFIGTGPVRGFAVTLGIGILTTVFTAFTLTRLIVATGCAGGGRNTCRSNPASAARSEITLAPLSASFPTTPSSTSCASGASASRCRRCCRSWRSRCYFSHGLNFGIDFVGGTLLEVQAKSGPADLAACARRSHSSISATCSCSSSAGPRTC